MTDTTTKDSDTAVAEEVCGAPGRDDEEHIDVTCDLKPFHREKQHHAHIPSQYDDIGSIGELHWPVDKMHRIPTHLYGVEGEEPSLVDLMTELRYSWEEITERLTHQFLAEGTGGQDEAIELMAQAEEEILEGEQIVRDRQILHQHIEEARKQVQQALAALNRLGCRDVEYEDPEHTDTHAHLNDAGRLIRAAQAVKPTDADGELK